MTDKDGDLVYSYEYGTYGELKSTTEYGTTTPIIRFLYNGQLGVATDENGLYYMRSRYYNTDIKRFINQDVLIGSIGNSNSLNRYSYVEGNPVSYTDPFGLSPFSYISEPLHRTLDWFGMIPFVGAGFDLINATIYLMEGKPAYALFTAFSSIGIGDGVKFVIKNGKKALAGLTITGLFCQTDAGATLKMEISGLTQEYITYHGYDQMSKTELALALTLELFMGAKSGLDDLDIQTKKVDVDVDDFVPDNATNKAHKIDGDDLVPDNSPTSRGYYQDSTGKWHRPNGEYASNAEVGIAPNNSTNSTSSTTTGCPNPYGKKGGPAHQSTIASIQPSRSGGTMDYEKKYVTPDGNKKYRYADAVEMNNGQVTSIHQVGKVNKDGTPVVRERQAIQDIMSSPDYKGEPIYFWPYNSNSGPILINFE